MEQASKWAFLRAWENPEAGERAAIFQRYVRIQRIAIPVATVTFSYVNKSAAQKRGFDVALQDARTLVARIKADAGLGQWQEKVDRASGTAIFRSDSAKQNRFYQIFFRDLGDRYAISSSSVRRLYAFPIAAEASVLQTAMMDAAGTRQAADTRSWGERALDASLWSILPRAEAQTGGVTALSLAGRSISISGLGALPTGEITRIIGELGTTGRGVLLDTINSGRIQGETFLRNAGGIARTTADGIVGDATGRVEATGNRLIRAAGEEGRRTVAEAEAAAMRVERAAAADVNRTINRLTSSTNILRMAFMAGVGGTIGSMVATTAVNFLVDGSVSLVSSAYHLVMGTMSQEERQRMDQELGGGLGQLEQASQRLTGIETELDRRIAALQVATDMQLDLDRAPSVIDRRLGQNRAEQLALEREVSRSNIQNCGSLFYLLDEVKQNLQGLRAVVGVGGRAGLCSQIQDLLNQWIGAELALHNARNVITNNWSRLMSRQSQELLRASAGSPGPRRSRVDCQRELDELMARGVAQSASPQCVSSVIAELGGARTAANESQARRTCEARARVATDSSVQNLRAGCVETVDVIENRDRSAAFVNGLRLTEANQEIARQFILRMAQSDCEEGASGGVCDGQTGAFRQIRDRYVAKFGAALRYCPNLTRPRALDNLDRPSPQLGVSGPVEPPATARSAGRESEGPGWIRRQLISLGSLFSSMFG